MTIGIYTLVIKNQKDQYLIIGKLGNFFFPQGLYVYIGSALGKSATNLENRLQRHLSKLKRRFWHIDFFLSSESVEIIAIYFAITSEKRECQLASSIISKDSGIIIIPRFGASDCKNNCKSHLVYFQIEQAQLMSLIQSTFYEINLKPLDYPLTKSYNE